MDSAILLNSKLVFLIYSAEYNRDTISISVWICKLKLEDHTEIQQQIKKKTVDCTLSVLRVIIIDICEIHEI